MNAFPPVTLEFKGKQYTVPSDRVWGLIGTIEEHITHLKLGTAMFNHDLPRFKVSEAICAALVYAGARDITPGEVSTAYDIGEMIGQAAGLAQILRLAEKKEDPTAEAEPVQGKSKRVSKKSAN